MNESEAIARLKQGDIAGLETLVRHYQERAVRAAWLITCDRTLAEDIVQSAFLRVYERIHQFDSSRPFGAWFLKIVSNDAVRASQRAARTVPVEADASFDLPDFQLSPEELIEQAETRQEVWEALAKLTPLQREAVVLRYFLGLSENEVAQELDCPPGTAKRRLHSARQRLRQLLGMRNEDRGIKTP
jgi:RNA polymerase sigma-70 factor, ECF subfamily